MKKQTRSRPSAAKAIVDVQDNLTDRDKLNHHLRSARAIVAMTRDGIGEHTESDEPGWALEVVSEHLDAVKELVDKFNLPLRASRALAS